jgi:hypothetical protein
MHSFLILISPIKLVGEFNVKIEKLFSGEPTELKLLSEDVGDV